MLIKIILILVSIMYITLLERKVLGLSQNRLGAGKVGFMGLVQPILDGLKLVIKEVFIPLKGGKGVFWVSPLIILLTMFVMFDSLPEFFFESDMKFMYLFLICCFGISVYAILFCGWVSNSKFSVLGGLRSVAQTISYEVSLIFLLFSFLIFKHSLGSSLGKTFNLIFLLLLPVAFFWMLTVVAECNRAPFDFSEGESELVSGFNLEFGSSGFALLFIGEYGMVMFFSVFSAFLFFYPLVFIGLVVLTFMFLAVRSTFPRYRYDKLMNLAWYKILPASCVFFVSSALLSFFL